MLSPLRNRAGRRLREPFGKAGLTVAVIALVFAMLGGAYAAGKLTSKQKKEVEKIAKKFQGTGPAGAQGPAGAAGAKGDTGSAGSNGSNGANGAGVISATLSEGDANCEYGGSKFTAASGATYACNGEPGEEGPEGSPWTAGGTLPSKKTETGAWAFGPVPVDHGQVDVPISLFLPLPNALSESSAACGIDAPNQPSTCQVHYLNAAGKEVVAEQEKTSTYCHGSAAAPTADPGHLCIYTGEESNALSDDLLISRLASPEKGASTVGAVLTFYLLGEGRAKGTYAVTSP